MLQLQQRMIITYQQDMTEMFASDGDLDGLRQHVVQQQQQQQQQQNGNHVIQTLLSTKDRNGSTAEHWAAGG
eukprot:13187298-Ditylum_brightwellii.AAC.1